MIDLATRDNLTPESEWTPGDPNAAQYRAPDAMASEHEVSTFVAALVYLLKPRRILETGCYHGDTTVELATVAKTYGGCVVAVDICEDACAIARKRCRRLPAVVMEWNSAEIDTAVPFDFLYLDCVAPDKRPAVLRRMIQTGTLKSMAWVAIHDTAKHHGGHWAYTDMIPLRLQFPCPRGLLVGRLGEL